MTEGWKCPVCGRGVAPSEKHCDHGGAAVLPYYPMPVYPYPWPYTYPHPYYGNSYWTNVGANLTYKLSDISTCTGQVTYNG